MLLKRSLLKILLLLLTIMPSVWLHCYRLKMFTSKTTDTPGYRLEMKLHTNQTLSSFERVMEEVRIPVWNLILVQHSARTNSINVFYNSTMKVCDFWRYIKRIRIFTNVVENLFKREGTSNVSFKCPLEVGTYFVRNIMVPADSPILKLMYVPNTMYTLFGNIYSELPNKNLLLKCSYEINATILKSC